MNDACWRRWPREPWGTTAALLLAFFGWFESTDLRPAEAQDLADRTDPPADGVSPKESTASTALARLGDRMLTRSQVDLVLGRAPALHLPPLEPAVEKAAVELLAKRLQALQTLRKLGLVPDRPAILEWIARNRGAEAPEDWLRDSSAEWGVSPTEVVEDLAFRLSWETYLGKHLTEANLLKHFDNQRARFDGTRFLISMVTVAAPVGSGPKRDEVASRLATWARTIHPDAWEHSPAPQPPAPDWHCDARRWIRGTGVCDPWIVDSVLALQPGDPPAIAHTAAGVHAVWLHQRQPGKLQFEQARDDVRAHLLVFLLDYLARQSSGDLPLRSVDG